MKRILLLLAAAALPGVAAAASGSASAAADAQVAFYSGFPNAGGQLVTTMSATAAMQASAQNAVEKADSAVVKVSGHAYTFALDASAKAKGQAEFDVKGVAGAAGYGKAGLKAVIGDIAKAQNAQQPLVVLSRTQGQGRVVLALYHPNGGNAGLRVKNADHATVWVGGKAHGYNVSANGGSGLVSSLQVHASGGQKALTSTVADLQTTLALGTASGSTSSSTNGSSSNGSTSGTSGGNAGGSVGGTVTGTVNGTVSGGTSGSGSTSGSSGSGSSGSSSSTSGSTNLNVTVGGGN